MDQDEVVRAWQTLPRRIYLDTSTLQTLYDFGEVVWDGEPFEPTGRAARVRGLSDELDALRRVFLVNGRAHFEFAVTEASLREVLARDRPRFTAWVFDVLDSWLVQSEGDEHARTTVFNERRFGQLSSKDRRLLQEALDVGCDGFMTMERRLPTAASFVERATGLRIMRPTTYWDLLSRWSVCTEIAGL